MNARMLVLDTNVYIDLFDDRELAERVAGTLAGIRQPLHISSVVVAELLAGTATAHARREVERLVLPPAVTDRLVTPSHDDWMTAASALADLGGDAITSRRSFWNDLLIAASCARVGAALMTRDADDFRRIRRAIPVQLVARPI